MPPIQIPGDMELAAVLGFLDARTDDRGRPVETDEREPTIEALRWHLEILRILGRSSGQAPGTALLPSFAHGTAGFRMTKSNDNASMAATYYGVRIAALLGVTLPGTPGLTATVGEAIDRELNQAEPDLDELFYAVRALHLLNGRFSEATCKRIANLIVARSSAHGGIAATTGAPPNVEHTYCAIQMLRLLRITQAADARARHRQWLQDSCNEGRFQDETQPARSPVAMAYWGVHAALLLQARFRWSQIAGDIAGHRPSDGGYGESSRSTLWETYCALRALALIGDRQ